MSERYLLDTSVLLILLRGGRPAQDLERRFGLLENPFKPLVCEVSFGELLAFSRDSGWGESRRAKLREAEKQLTIVDISMPEVREAYADISTEAKRGGWELFTQKNDLWIAAATRVTQSHLLTLDKDFSPLSGSQIATVTIIDPKSLPRTK